jgi:hypothetical protein
MSKFVLIVLGAAAGYLITLSFDTKTDHIITKLLYNIIPLIIGIACIVACLTITGAITFKF